MKAAPISHFPFSAPNHSIELTSIRLLNPHTTYYPLILDHSFQVAHSKTLSLFSQSPSTFSNILKPFDNVPYPDPLYMPEFPKVIFETKLVVLANNNLPIALQYLDTL